LQLLQVMSGYVNIRRLFYVKVFNANAPSYRAAQDSSLYIQFEREKQQNVLAKLKWDLLHHLYFQYLVEWVVSLLYFTRDLLITKN